MLQCKRRPYCVWCYNANGDFTVYDLQCKQGLNLYDVTMQTETLLCMIYNANGALICMMLQCKRRPYCAWFTMQTETLLCMIYNANRALICMMLQCKRRPYCVWCYNANGNFTVYDLQCKQGPNLYDVTMQTETLLCMIYNANRVFCVWCYNSCSPRDVASGGIHYQWRLNLNVISLDCRMSDSSSI